MGWLDRWVVRVVCGIDGWLRWGGRIDDWVGWLVG